jgi:hypothetical protein
MFAGEALRKTTTPSGQLEIEIVTGLEKVGQNVDCSRAVTVRRWSPLI